jgi:hypothetical protein
MTLCEAYMGIKCHFDLRNYFFHARLRQDLDAKTAVLGSVDLLVRSRSRIDPYFCILTSDPLVGWQKVWFFLRNDADALLPTVTSDHPTPQPKWWYSMAQGHIRKLEPLHDRI